jgi:Phage integrase, N-terminal SAM-like domain
MTRSRPSASISASTPYRADRSSSPVSTWLEDRRLEPRSRELYAMLLRLHIMPWFGDLALDRITPPMVRSWRTDLLRQGRSESTAAKSYRLLRAILNTAVKDDRLLGENPCRMRGFDKEPTSERPTASVDQVWRLAALMPPRFRALVIFAASPACAGVSWWLSAAPHRQHVGGLVGASTRELIHRTGHASMPAALIYQHATSERDREIAAAIDARIERGDAR